MKQVIRDWGRALGFSAVGFARATPLDDRAYLEWLADGRHGDMDYMARHLDKRHRPDALVPGTRTVISVRLDYGDAGDGPISRYARGRDYHKVLRHRLQKLAERIEAGIGPFGHRAFTDSAPVPEVEFATQAGLGWRGKHTLMLSRQGSWCFLGELYTDLDLPPDAPVDPHCGRCQACLDHCPTQAILAPYVLDARRCISYLTIEHRGAIPEPLRALMGTRVYGCDDCQAVCPWNRFAGPAELTDFRARPELAEADLARLFLWSEAEFETVLAGSPIRRIGYERWLRNLAVGLGNSAPTDANRHALAARRDHPSALVREHVAWAGARLG